MALDRRLLSEDGSQIDLEQYALRHAAHLSVGTCEALGCRGQLVPLGDRPTERMGAVQWLTFGCNRCGSEFTSPDGRLGRRPRALITS